ncbi:hypothetical protein BpHYR1_042550, partial [Brachionus plicatilis]
MIRHKRELKVFISHLAAAEVEISITALYVKWLRQYARYTQMSIGVDQPLSLTLEDPIFFIPLSPKM